MLNNNLICIPFFDWVSSVENKQPVRIQWILRITNERMEKLQICKIIKVILRKI